MEVEEKRNKREMLLQRRSLSEIKRFGFPSLQIPGEVVFPSVVLALAPVCTENFLFKTTDNKWAEKV